MNPTITEIKNTSIAWFKTGKGKPLIILHGWGSNAAVMMPIAERVKDIRTSYLIDFPGFGHSAEPETAWGIDDFAELTEEFLNIKLPDQSFDLLVHSFGARVALKLLTRKEISSRIDKVIFTGAAGLKPKRKGSYYFRKYTAKILKLPFYLLPGSLRENGLNRLKNTGLWRKLGSSDYQKLSGVMRETFVKTVNEHMDHLLPQIQHEVLLIWGKNDAATPLDQAKRMEKGLKKNALILIEDAGHYAFLDKPAQFGAILQAYLEPDK